MASIQYSLHILQYSLHILMRDSKLSSLLLQSISCVIWVLSIISVSLVSTEGLWSNWYILSMTPCKYHNRYKCREKCRQKRILFCVCVHRVRGREVTCCFRSIRKWPSRSAEIWSTSISYRRVECSLYTLFTKVLSFKRKWFDVRLVTALHRGCRSRLVVVDCISCQQEQLGFFFC